MSRSRTTTSDSVESVPSTVTASRTTRSRATPSAKPNVTSRAKTGDTARTATKNRLATRQDAGVDTQDESPTKPPTTASTATRLTSLKSRTVSQTKPDVPKPTTATGGRTTSRVAAPRTVRNPVTAKREDPKPVVNGEVDELAASIQNTLTLNGNAKASSSKPQAKTTVGATRPRLVSRTTMTSNTTNSNGLGAKTRTRIGAPVSEMPVLPAGSVGRRTIGSRTTSSSASRPPVSAGTHSRSSTAVSQTGNERAERLTFLPPDTILRVEPEALDLAQLQQVKTNLNKGITAIKSAQAEGYRYERLGAARTSEARKGSPIEDGKVKEWTDATMKVAIDDLSIVLRQLMAHLLSISKDGSEWMSEALTAVRSRMQIAKACSDFGLVSVIAISVRQPLYKGRADDVYCWTALFLAENPRRESANSSGHLGTRERSSGKAQQLGGCLLPSIGQQTDRGFRNARKVGNL